MNILRIATFSLVFLSALLTHCAKDLQTRNLGQGNNFDKMNLDDENDIYHPFKGLDPTQGLDQLKEGIDLAAQDEDQKKAAEFTKSLIDLLDEGYKELEQAEKDNQYAIMQALQKLDEARKQMDETIAMLVAARLAQFAKWVKRLKETQEVLQFRDKNKRKKKYYYMIASANNQPTPPHGYEMQGVAFRSFKYTDEARKIDEKDCEQRVKVYQCQNTQDSERPYFLWKTAECHGKTALNTLGFICAQKNEELRPYPLVTLEKKNQIFSTLDADELKKVKEKNWQQIQQIGYPLLH